MRSPRLAPEVVELCQHLKVYFRLERIDNVFPLVLTLAALDVANVPEDATWTDPQRNAWLHCRGEGRKLIRLLLSHGPLSALLPSRYSEMSLPELKQCAKDRGIDVRWKRRYALIELLEEGDHDA